MKSNAITEYVRKKGLEGTGLHSFFFIKPKRGANLIGLTKKLMAIDAVQEICVTEGDAGFLVKAKFDDKLYDSVKGRIANAAGSKYGVCISALEFKKVEA